MLRRGHWGLDDIEPLPGISLLAHVESLLPPDGRGPVFHGGEPLPDAPPRNPATVQWGGGAMDGITALRFGGSGGQEGAVAAAATIALVRGTPTTTAVHALATTLATIPSPQQMDRFLGAIRDAPGVPRDRLAVLARWFGRHGTRRGTVKAALALLGVSGSPGDQDLVLRLGLLEELTLFAAVALRNLLPEPHRAIFDLAQQVEGWGRVHTVQRLAGTHDPEIKDWLLRGGFGDAILGAEVAYIAATTGGLREALGGPVDDDLLDHAGALLDLLAVGGPAEDMRDYPDGGPALAHYFAHLATATATLRQLDHLVGLERYVTRWAADNPHLTDGERERLRAQVAGVLARPDWAPLVHRALGSDDVAAVRTGASLSDRFGIDAAPLVQDALTRFPHEGYLWAWLASHSDDDALPALVADADRLLPLAALANGPANDLGGGLEYAADLCLQTLVQRLADAPGVGWNAVDTALRNRVTGVRNSAVRALKAWPRDRWPADAEVTLTRAMWAEPNHGARKNMRAVLEGFVD